MNPAELRDLLAAYADGELESDLRLKVDQHLAAHPELRITVERWQALRACTRRVIEQTSVPPGLTERIQARLRELPQEEARPRPHFFRLGLSGVAAAAVVLLGFTLWTRGATNTVDAARLAQIYDSCAVRARHDTFRLRAGSGVSDDMLKSLRSRAAFACAMPSASPEGFAVDGACECSPTSDVRTIHLYFRCPRDPQRVVSVFAMDKPVTLRSQGTQCAGCQGAKRSYLGTHSGNVTLVYWQDQQYSYALAAALPQQELVQIADGLQVAQIVNHARALLAARSTAPAFALP
jgi:anti-sigma factor RsiW